MGVEVAGTNTVADAVRELYGRWFKIYRKDDRESQFVRHLPPRGKEDAQKRSVNQILLQSNLDELGIEQDGGASTIEACSAIVDILFEVSPKALAAWVEDHDEPIEFLVDHNDVRIITISKLAQEKLKGTAESI